MKVSLKGLYDPETYFGLEDVVIMLCKGMRKCSAKTLDDKRAELAMRLSQASSDRRCDLNNVIASVINIAPELHIDFNEINDIKSKNPQIDVSVYNKYSDSAQGLIDELKKDGVYPRRLAMLNALCSAIFLSDDTDSSYDEIENDIKKMIKFSAPELDFSEFNDNAEYKKMGVGSAELILEKDGLYTPPAKDADVQEQTAVSPEITEKKPGSVSPRAVLFVQRKLSSLSLANFKPINTASNSSSQSNSAASSRAQSPTSPQSPYNKGIMRPRGSTLTTATTSPQSPNRGLNLNPNKG